MRALKRLFQGKAALHVLSKKSTCLPKTLSGILILKFASEIRGGRKADSSLTTPELHPKEQRPLFGNPGTEIRSEPRSLLMNKAD